VSARVGFVLGTAPCGQRSCTVTLRTTNRGASWVELSAPAAQITFGDMSGVWGVRFADARRGYAFGAGLWQTTDGAGSWQHVSIPGRVVLALATVQDREVVIATTACAHGFTCAKGIALYHRRLTATKWQRFAGVTGVSNFNTSITVHGKVVRALLDYGLYVSTDGGVSFQSHSQPCVPPPGGILSPAAITDDGSHSYLLCTGPAGPGSIGKFLYRTTTTSATWTQVGRPPEPGGPDGFAAGSDKAIVLAAASGASFLYRSTDGGRHWRTALTDYDGGVGWGDLAFTSATDGAVIHGAVTGPGSGEVLLTNDGGRTWHRTAL
jgi:photosystem II stability/assembly factor-like uncharacterized protein